MHWIDLFLIPIVLRVCLVVLFPFSALDKIVGWKGALKQAKSGAIPGAPVLLVVAIVVEAVAPFCIVIGWHDRIAAFILACFCVMTALVYHNFWHYPDFWSNGDSKARSHFWDFLKNFGLVGGLLLITFGAQLMPWHQVVTHPISSTPVYSAAAVHTPARTPRQP